MILELCRVKHIQYLYQNSYYYNIVNRVIILLIHLFS